MIEDKARLPGSDAQEDQEDYLIAVARLEENLPTVPLEEVLKELGLDGVRLVGCDLPIHADPHRYRDLVERIKTDERERGALITTHKIDVFEACRDLFDSVVKPLQLRLLFGRKSLAATAFQ